MRLPSSWLSPSPLLEEDVNSPASRKLIPLACTLCAHADKP